MKMIPRFAGRLLEWYRLHQRDLPWRKTRDPYRIWLSEVILQQTRVAQGLAYYERFVEHYPTVHHLAKAPIEEVLRLWQGLGYYSRARNLHAAARTISIQWAGRFPASYDELRRLKGVGDYTAAAIASFAFDEPVAVVDGNVFRVLARLYGLYDDISRTKTKHKFKALSEAHMPPQEAAAYNQAMMEFGAVQCTPQKPLCMTCPFRDDCYAAQYGKQQELPVKSKKTTKRKRYLSYRFFYRNGKLWMQERKQKDIWKGLYEPARIEAATAREMEQLLQNEAPAALWQQAQAIEQIRHLLTHQELFIDIGMLHLPPDAALPPFLKDGGDWFTPEECDALPKPIVIAQYFERHRHLLHE
ncbi:A/G-specific adenine glycosylase [Thermonema rossianum]|uniref:A/G-specific adenine glycosylase n=1 Tax=Thermonema rossianum TaxID=55505 RepID=UPI00057127D8|nr:A/G-specific adenine glycosylase [Thermonema rossianum]